jgi:hypothetical protein
VLLATASAPGAGAHPAVAQPRLLALDGLALGLEAPPALLAHQAEPAAGLGQAQIGVVLAQQQPVLGAAGEHAVGLVGAAGDQVIDQHAEVGLVPARRPGLAPLHRQRRVGAGQQPLGGGLLVAGGAVDLAGEIEPGTKRVSSVGAGRAGRRSRTRWRSRGG